MKDRIIQIVQTTAAGIFGLSSSGQLYQLDYYGTPSRGTNSWGWRKLGVDDHALLLPAPPKKTSGTPCSTCSGTGSHQVRGLCLACSGTGVASGEK